MTTSASPVAARTTIGDALWLVATAGLAAGLGEAALRFALLPLRELLGNRISLNPQSVWMGPLVSALLLLIPVLITREIANRVRVGAYSYAATTLVAAFFSIFAVTMITRRVSDLALAALALGLAWQIGRLAQRRPGLVRSLVRRMALSLGLISLATTAWLNGGTAWRERRQLASLPPAADEVPNVLLIILDTVRGLEVGFGGYQRATTPNIDRWAARGVVFDRAIAPAPWTLPSHASMFTGKWPHELELGWSRPFGEEHTTIAERMSALGYVTGGFVANLIYCSYLFGLNRGFATYRDYQFSPTELLGSSTLGRRLIDLWNRTRGTYVVVGRKTAAEINEEVLGWLRGVSDGRPWFAFVNYFDAHDPYDVPPPYREMFAGTNEKWRSLSDLRPRSSQELAALQSAYDGAIAYLDMEVGRLLEDLDQQGVLRNTLVIITSDHGEEFGEHGITGHGTSLYTPVVHVPLVILPPGGPSDTRRLSRYVSLRDLAATIEDAARPADRRMPGASLGPLWMGDPLAPISPAFSEVDRLASIPSRYPVSKASMQSLIVDDRWHFIRSGTGAEELYDLSVDFWERDNLAMRSEHSSRIRQMRDSITAIRDTPRQAFVAPAGAVANDMRRSNDRQ